MWNISADAGELSSSLFAVKMPVDARCMAGCRMRTPRRRPPVPSTRRYLAENLPLTVCCVSPCHCSRNASAGVCAYRYVAWRYRHFLRRVDGLCQYDIRRLIAYTSVSHMGFVLIAIYTGSQRWLPGGGDPNDRARSLRSRSVHSVASYTNVLRPSTCV